MEWGQELEGLLLGAHLVGQVLQGLDDGGSKAFNDELLNEVNIGTPCQRTLADLQRPVGGRQQLAYILAAIAHGSMPGSDEVICAAGQVIIAVGLQQQPIFGWEV